MVYQFQIMVLLRFIPVTDSYVFLYLTATRGG